MEKLVSLVVIKALQKVDTQMIKILFRIINNGATLESAPSGQRTMIITHWSESIPHFSATVEVTITGVDQKCKCGCKVFVGEFQVSDGVNPNTYTIDIWMEPITSKTRSGQGYISSRKLIPMQSDTVRAEIKSSLS